MIRRIFCLALMFVVTLCTAAHAAYPDHPITLIVPFGAGGGTDVPARLVANMLEKKLGQPIVVQNIVGGSGTQGVAQITGSKPDGYTLGYIPVGTVCLQPHTQKLPYGKDSFTFLGMVTRQPVVLMSSKVAPWKNLEGMIEAVRKNPNKYVVAITGTANMTHVPVVELAEKFGLQFRYIPYRSTPEIMKDMIAGRVQLHADAPAALSQFDVYGLVQYVDVPVANLNMPTTKEVGLDKPMVHWQGIMGPKNMPAEVTGTLAKAIEEVVASKEFAEEATKISSAAYWMGPEAFQKQFDQEFEYYGGVLKEMLSKK
ncbi:Bug family tripartite tricarboxylate transporter substrate binding protein [Desulfovibrio cuneatus]|uniref:Bug family tripartite tricarboxylate transporter substrate binding protein n=1 Tax=Desulfovibrio cuneatus TaxID=159728 RepID=UPI0004054E4B|nr:tripartite tricarboxylate transporter substrate binding protein [Desulfovibrio cuneatus]